METEHDIAQVEQHLEKVRNDLLDAATAAKQPRRHVLKWNNGLMMH